jgi:hypothetical protein
MRRNGEFFRAGMGSQFGKVWRYRRQEMQMFIMKYGALSIPAFDLERIESCEGLETLEIIEKATGYKYVAPISVIGEGYARTMSRWQEPNQFFIPVEKFDIKMPKGKKGKVQRESAQRTQPTQYVLPLGG